MTSTIAQLQDYGQIKQISLPDGWVGGRVDFGHYDQRSLVQFTPSGIPDVRVCFFYRGLPVDDESGHRFRALLEVPAHKLTSDELESMAVVLSNLAIPKAFTIESAETIELNGKSVVSVTGTWLDSGHKNWGLLISTDGSGSVIQEIHFIAPSELYDLYLSEASAAINSVEWK